MPDSTHVSRWGLRRLSAGLIFAAAFSPLAHGQIAVRNQGYLPYGDAPINYRSDDLDDPVAKLQQDIDQGKRSLAYEPEHGYLKSVLSLLQVPADSQTLVFSKTSFQYPKISPAYPRALYYNDDVYVGSVHDGKAIEIVSFDPRQGAIFYLLDERKVEKPVFQRAELDCTQCHIAAATRGIPGVFLRSVYPTPAGNLVPGLPSYVTDQQSPLNERWGGWYVNGPLATPSMANAAVAESAAALGEAHAEGGKLAPLTSGFESSGYLEHSSDPIALLVLAHQTQMHNLITLTNYKTRLALYAEASRAGSAADGVKPVPTGAVLSEETRRQFERPADQMLSYLLFNKEASLSGADAQEELSDSQFAREFSARGIRDSKGRSLRDFDLNSRIFRYPCSYLIYSSSFDALPEPAKSYVYHRLLQILTGQDSSSDFSGLAPADRQAVLEILLETKTGLPAEWTDYASAHHLAVARSAH